MMANQQINLYQDIFREQQQPVSARQVGLAVLGLIVLLALVSGFLQWQHQGLNTKLAEREQRKAELEQQVATLRQKLEARQGDRQLQEAVEALNNELAAKQQILQALSGKRFGNTDGFVEHLTGLARQRIDGLWLTELALRQGGTRLDMQGRSLKPESVPNYLQKLSAETIFAGTEFDNLSISRNAEQPRHMDFQLQSRVKQEPAE
ncbi:PilN domain-containing protein [Thiohalophilus sp.]|uniref:PilN domain-containing protein n=1 Tax=Thiohalophilus sp. TaxID=3028392 RepID=UPI003975AB0C